VCPSRLGKRLARRRLVNGTDGARGSRERPSRQVMKALSEEILTRPAAPTSEGIPCAVHERKRQGGWRTPGPLPTAHDLPQEPTQCRLRCHTDQVASRQALQTTGAGDLLGGLTLHPRLSIGKPSDSTDSRCRGPDHNRICRGPLCGRRSRSSDVRLGSLWRALHSDPYAHVSTMHRGLEIAGVGPCSDEALSPTRSAHSYSVCRNRSSESGAL
jgi:hypothetical protein